MCVCACMSVRCESSPACLIHRHIFLGDCLERGLIFVDICVFRYKVTVVAPNLKDLLANTPADMFAPLLPNWRDTPLFYLHYTELLRLAALYK
jgi:hypothetical protein